MSLRKTGKLAFRIGLAGLFGYFGTMAILEPANQAATWLSPQFEELMSSMVSVEVGVLLFGIAQVAVAAAILFKLLLRWALLLAAIMLVGIIANLGFNETALRDLVLLTGVFYFYTQES